MIFLAGCQDYGHAIGPVSYTHLGMFVVLTTSQEDHVQGPTAPALQQALPEAYKNRVKRTGIVNVGRPKV